MELELLASPLATFKIDGNIMSTICWRRVLKLYFLEVELQGGVLPRGYRSIRSDLREGTPRTRGPNVAH